MVYSLNITERHHCLMGEKIIYTFGDRQFSIIKFVFLLILSEKSKIHLRGSS